MLTWRIQIFLLACTLAGCTGDEPRDTTQGANPHTIKPFVPPAEDKTPSEPDNKPPSEPSNSPVSDPDPTNPTTQPEPEPEPDPGPPGLPLESCQLTAVGAMGHKKDPIPYEGQQVEVNAGHLPSSRCLAGITLVFKRNGACPLTVEFGIDNGIWTLTTASLRSDPQCGNGWGSGKTYTPQSPQSATLLGLPEMVATSEGTQSCTGLTGRIDLLGTLVLEAGGTEIEVTLTGLSVEGSLLSTVTEGSGCGAPPEICQGMACGTDPLFGTDCGSCQAGTFCLDGQCEEGSPAQEACARFNQDRAQLFEGQWSGSVNQCQPGAMSNDWQKRALLSTNLYRWFAGLPPLKLEPAWYAGEQACALIMDANNSLSHYPSTAWKCYTKTGADAASSSNIATTPAVDAMDLYMVDTGNQDTMGHRRWILSNWLSKTAFGSTSDYSCMATQSGGNGANKSWTAWPPAGFYPLNWHKLSWGPTTDSVGWTLQSDSINLKNAKVSVTQSGQARPMWVGSLPSGYGSKYAIIMVPQGWTMQPNATYKVQVSGINAPFSYEIHAVDCNQI